jgi:hypothetical protein
MEPESKAKLGILIQVSSLLQADSGDSHSILEAKDRSLVRGVPRNLRLYDMLMLNSLLLWQSEIT